MDRAKDLDATGPAAPPRKNGELLFEAPWESRAFGVAVALCEQGAFEWVEFQRLLIEEIAKHERERGQGEPYRYYACWLAALERLLAARALCTGGEVDALSRTLAARPPGHDHDHDHDHDDEHGHGA